MEKLRLLRYLFMVLSLMMSVSLINGQVNKSKEAEIRDSIEEEMEKARQAEIRAEMEEEVKARKEMLERQQQEMKEQQLKMQEMEREFRDQAIEFERQHRESAHERESFRFMDPGTRTYRLPDGQYLLGSYGQGNQSQLTLRNSFNGGSDSSKGEFDVDKEVRHFRCLISGKVKSGEISIQVKYPGGKMFKDLTINSSAEISFSQSLTIKEGEEDKYVGTWQYQVTAKEAEGNYLLQIITE